jgi:cytochrome P450
MTESDLPVDAILDRRTFTDPDALHGLLARLRRTDPMPRLEVAGYRPFWLVTRHADITAIELDARRFINAPTQAIFPLRNTERAQELTGGNVQQQMRNLVAMDGEDHRAYRAISQSQFLSKALNAIRADIEGLAAEFVGRMAGRDGTCDFSVDIAMWYPLRVIMTILGIPREDEALMLDFAQRVLSAEDPEFQRAGENGSVAAIMEMYQYMAPVIADRRANPRDDIGSVIATAKVDGAYLAERDVFGYFLILATAGHDTTSYALAGGLLALMQNPDQMAKLRADPALIPSAVDEMIRWTTPVRHFARTATEDATIGGQAIKAGDLFLLSYPSANRDEAVFEDPFAFRIDRKPNRHLAFGTGPHLCLGQHLARMELMAFLREFLARVEHIELAGTPRWTEATFVGGVKRLPVRYRFRDPIEQAA